MRTLHHGTWISILYVYLSLELSICLWVCAYRYTYITTVVIWALRCLISPSARLIVQKVNKKRPLKLCILYPLRRESTYSKEANAWMFDITFGKYLMWHNLYVCQSCFRIKIPNGFVPERFINWYYRRIHFCNFFHNITVFVYLQSSSNRVQTYLCSLKYSPIIVIPDWTKAVVTNLNHHSITNENVLWIND